MIDVNLRVSDEDLARIGRAIEDEQAALDRANAERRRRLDEKQRADGKAEAAEIERQRLEARRRELLPRLNADDAAAAAKELAQVGTAIANTTRQLTDYAEAAELLAAPVLELNPQIEGHARRLRELQVIRRALIHRRAAEQLHAALEQLAEPIRQFVETAAGFEVAHRFAYDDELPRGHEAAELRLAKALTVWARGVVGTYGQMIQRVWPAETGSLVRPLEDLTRDHVGK